MIVTFLSLYCRCSADRCGMLATHGPHHVAQNSTTYVFPFSKLATGAPFTHFSIESAGAFAPATSEAFLAPAPEPSCADAKPATRTRATAAEKNERMDIGTSWSDGISGLCATSVAKLPGAVLHRSSSNTSSSS